MQQKITAAKINAAPTIDPMTMPAMAPPESPDFEPPAPAPAVADAVADEVLVGNNGGIETVVGSVTPSQRFSTLELIQHELVEFTVLSLQYEHNPCRLFWNPHSVGSFFTALMQLPLKASAGFEQRVKSARIWGTALLPGFPQRAGLETILCSLMAKSACSWSAFAS